MRAVVAHRYGPPETLVVEDLPPLAAGAGEVVVSVHASAVNFPDTLIIEDKYQLKPRLPFSPGGEVAGTIRAIGEGVSGFRVGDPVIAGCRYGGFAEEVVITPDRLVAIPAGVSMEAAAALLVAYGTSHYALQERAAIRPGETLLVLGAAGGTGLSAIELGKLMGARVIAAASTPEKRAFAAHYGADETVDYTQADWRDTLKTQTGGKGPDVIYDPVGGEVSLQAFRSIAWRGRHLVVGFASGTIPALAFNLPLLKGGALLGVDLAQIQKREPETHARLIAQLFDWLASGKLQPVVGKVVAFENFREAFKTMQSRSALGKMIIKFP
jgi:NADPH:quinone reductase